VKLGVWPGFELPDLRGALNGAAPGAVKRCRLEAVYFDTPDLRLLRRGVTLRFRRGEEPGEVWTAKLPEETPALGMARREVTVQAGPANVPVQLVDLVRGWALGAPLSPVARLRTLRHRTTVTRPDGQPIAVVDDDEVSILEGARVAARFRELELELVDGAPQELLDRLAWHMQSAGAQPVDQMPKLVRALGPAALEPWDLAQPELGKRPTAAELIRARLIASAASLVDHIAAVVLDEDLEGVHQARVGIRRLRSDLRSAGPLLHATEVRPLRRELDWLMDQLGEVRDLDVVLSGLGAAAHLLDPSDQAAAEVVLDQAREDRAAAYTALRAELRTARCAALLEETARIAADPPFKGAARKLPAAEVLPQLVGRPLRELRREVERLGESPDDEGLHRVRIKVKRVRYATELAAPAVGKKARRAARALAKVQDVLGEHNDARTAEARLRTLGERTGASGAWAAGLMGGLELALAADCRERFAPAWSKAAAAKRWRWTR
jgi:CHAD domain-containing protein